MNREKLLGYVIVVLFLELCGTFWLGVVSMYFNPIFGLIYWGIMVICFCSLLFIDTIPMERSV